MHIKSSVSLSFNILTPSKQTSSSRVLCQVLVPAGGHVNMSFPACWTAETRGTNTAEAEEPGHSSDALWFPLDINEVSWHQHHPFPSVTSHVSYSAPHSASQSYLLHTTLPFPDQRKLSELSRCPEHLLIYSSSLFMISTWPFDPVPITSSNSQSSPQHLPPYIFIKRYYIPSSLCWSGWLCWRHHNRFKIKLPFLPLRENRETAKSRRLQ